MAIGTLSLKKSSFSLMARKSGVRVADPVIIFEGPDPDLVMMIQNSVIEWIHL